MSAEIINLSDRRAKKVPSRQRTIHPPCITCGHGVVDHFLGAWVGGLNCKAKECACPDYEESP